MASCPLCEKTLETATPWGWLCQCGEEIPFGFEKKDGDSCETCTVLNCPKRK
jgi:hypothetical protein